MKKCEWIQVTDKLPPIGTTLIVTVQDSIRQRRELRYPVTYREHSYVKGYGFYVNGSDLLMPEYSEVIAWMPLPEPYGEAENEQNI